MRYILDNDLHIHSQLSSCSADKLQTPERILAYAKENHLKNVCLTDHFWDETVPGASGWYAPQNYEWICQSKPLPQANGIRFLFGCEIDMDKHFTLGLARSQNSAAVNSILEATRTILQVCTMQRQSLKEPLTIFS